MKKHLLPLLVTALSVICSPVLAQSAKDTSTQKDTTLLGLPGDNLDLAAVLDLFLKSKTIEAFEKSLNEQKTGINNMDLDLDKKVDFIKVVTKKDSTSNAFTFVLQIAVSKTETQDVAVILVDKDKKGKVAVQIVGDPDLYGKNYVIEPNTKGTSSVTPNPAYSGADPAPKAAPAQPAVVVETVPIVQYVYSPVYVPYYPPYYYGYYPPYFAAFTVMAVGIYRANHWYGGGYGYHGGYHNTVVINHNHYNNYNNTRNTSNRVSHYNSEGRYNNGKGPNARPSNPSASTRPSNGAGSNRPSNPSASTRPSNGAGSNRPSNPSASTRPSNPSSSTRPSTSNNMASGRTRDASSGFSSRGGGGYGGGGYSGGGGRSSGRSGGGGGRRR